MHYFKLKENTVTLYYKLKEEWTGKARGKAKGLTSPSTTSYNRFEIDGKMPFFL